jgi:hypothetical protein
MEQPSKEEAEYEKEVEEKDEENLTINRRASSTSVSKDTQ